MHERTRRAVKVPDAVTGSGGGGNAGRIRDRTWSTGRITSDKDTRTETAALHHFRDVGQGDVGRRS